MGSIKKEKISAEGEMSLKTYMEKISEITEWFEAQEEIDLEEALKKVRAAGELIKATKEKLKTAENEFAEIKKEMDGEE